MASFFLSTHSCAKMQNHENSINVDCKGRKIGRNLIAKKIENTFSLECFHFHLPKATLLICI